MNCNIASTIHETNVVRQELYKRGGLISVTSRILVVDMLQEDIPVQLITGMLILHAEKCVFTYPDSELSPTVHPELRHLSMKHSLFVSSARGIEMASSRLSQTNLSMLLPDYRP